MAGEPSLDDDLDSLDLGFVAKAALALCALSAASSFFTFLQLILFVRFAGWAKYAPYAFGVFALVSITLTAKSWGGRSGPALTLLVVIAMLFLFSIAWVIYSFASGFFAPLPVLTAALSTLATAVLSVSQKSFRRVDAAKKRLAEGGMTVGF